MIYALIAIVILWALVRQFEVAVPDGVDSDFYQFLWGYWWIRFALENGQSVLWTDYTLFPHVSNLSIHTLAPIWFPVFQIVEPLAGIVAAGNTMVLLSFPLTGTAMFAWLRRRLDSGSAGVLIAFVGGLLYAFSPYMLTHSAFIQMNLIALWWFPLILLLWDEIATPRSLPRLATTMLLGLALWGLWLTDLQFLVWLPFTITGYVLWTLRAARKNNGWLRLGVFGTLALLVMASLTLIYPLRAFLQVDSNPNEFPPAGPVTLHNYSLPTASLLGDLSGTQNETLGRVFIWLVWATVAMIVWRSWRRGAAQEAEPGKWLWLVLALPPLLLALGPDVTVGGAEIPLPYQALHDALNGQYRIPVRFIAPASALLITFIATAWKSWFVALWQSHRALAGLSIILLSAAVLVDIDALDTFPTRVWPQYEIHDQIAAEGGDFVIMDVPVGTHNGFTGMGDGFYSMFYGTFHEHRMVNGWLARTPYSTVRHYMDSPLFSWLAGARELNADEQTFASDELAGYIREWPLGYVFVYRDWIRPEKQLEWIGWLNMQAGLCGAEATPTADLIWWRTERIGCQPTISREIDMGAPHDWTHTGEGWFQPESIGGPNGRWAQTEAALRLTLEPDIAYELTFSALAFGEGRTLTLLGTEVIGQPLALANEDWREYTVMIPAGALENSVLRLQHNGSESPAALGLSDDERALAAAYAWFSLTPI